MTDAPSTMGFLCHICNWRERAESHDLMDTTALIRHGMRVHYLATEQVDEYREWYLHSCCVYLLKHSELTIGFVDKLL